MGVAGVADRFDPSNAYFNPANVAVMNGVFTAGSYELLYPSLISDAWFGHASVGAGYSFGDEHPFLLAFDVRRAKLSYGSYPYFEPGGVESKEEYVALTAGASTRLGRVNCAAGAAIKQWTADYAFEAPILGPEANPRDLSETAADVGAVVSSTVDASDWRLRPAIGVAFVNLGPDSTDTGWGQKAPFPAWFRYGFSVRVEGPVVKMGSFAAPVISGTLDFDGNHGLNEQDPYWGTGYELALMEILSVRWGRRFDDHYHDPLETWGIALGVPVGPVRARVDYAARTWLSAPDISRDVFGVSLAWLFDRAN